MGFGRFLILTCFLILLPSAVQAEKRSESDSLPPEMTRIIYETLLTPEGSGEKTPVPVEAAPPPGTKRAGMTVEKIADILRGRGIELRGKPGSWQFLNEGRQTFLFTDGEHNRMRLMTPLARLDMLRRDAEFSEIELLQKMMKANYLATGDVRLCMNKHVLWAAFLHPLDSLTERDLLSALGQLSETARKTSGGID